MAFAFNPQSEIPNPQLLRLFIYGTLKRGFWNHVRFCRGVLTVEDAVVHGRLFETPSEIPVLMVPEEDILTVGTTSPLADVATQARVVARMSNPQPTPDRLPKKGTGAPWGPVYGELLTFDDPETRLPAMDRLEGVPPPVCVQRTGRRRSLPLPPCSGPCPDKRDRAPGLALCGGGSLDWELQRAIRRNLALIFPSYFWKALDSNCQ